MFVWIDDTYCTRKPPQNNRKDSSILNFPDCSCPLHMLRRFDKVDHNVALNLKKNFQCISFGVLNSIYILNTYIKFILNYLIRNDLLHTQVCIHRKHSNGHRKSKFLHVDKGLVEYYRDHLVRKLIFIWVALICCRKILYRFFQRI